MFNKIKAYLQFLGIDIPKGIQNIKSLRWFFKDKKELIKQLEGNKDFAISQLVPIFSDRLDNGGVANGHYFHQDLLIAQKIYQNSPMKHVDVASRIDGFVAHVATFREIEVLDIRPIVSTTPNIKFTQADFTAQDFGLNQYADSVSCLHAIEHFGLGRYNDPIDAFGHIKGLQNIGKILKPGGKLYISTPIGRQRIEFNAQRVFNVSYLLALFEKEYQVNSFSFVDDSGNLHIDANLANTTDVENNFGCFYGCGIFELTRH